jgi:acyl-CoA:acyl-CoA alkyltransferase
VTPPGVLPSDMAVTAAKEAMERAKITPREIDAIIYTGLTRDYLEPATAHIVQAKLGATNALVFDISNACHGFMNGIHVMDALIATGQISHGLVVTGEQGNLIASRSIEALRKTTEREQFTSWVTGLTVGDAGGALIVGPKSAPNSGFMGFILQSQGQHAHLCTAGDPLIKGTWFADMPAIVDETAKLMAKMFHECMYGRLKWQIRELSKYLIHQVGVRAFQIYSQLTGVPTTIMPKTIDVLGNLITASIPVGIHYCLLNQEIRAGDKIYVSSTGSGISLSQAGLIWDAA